MHSKKKMLPVLFILLMLLFSLALPAAACVDRQAGDAVYQRMPQKFYLQGESYKGDPGSDYYRYKYYGLVRYTVNRFDQAVNWSPGPVPIPRSLPRPGYNRPAPGPNSRPEPGIETPVPGGDPDSGQVPDPGQEPGAGTEHGTVPDPEQGQDPGDEADPVPTPDPGLEPGPTPDPGQEPESGQEPGQGLLLSADETEMLRSVNEERLRAGLQPLKVHEGLVGLARQKSGDMISLGYFSHQSPTYGSPFDMIAAAGITYYIAGENIAGAPTVARAHQSLMDSPGHRANILQEGFTHVGIGIVDGGPYGKMFTQIFIGLK